MVGITSSGYADIISHFSHCDISLKRIQSVNHRITEDPDVEGTNKDHSVQLYTWEHPTLNISESTIQMLLELSQAWCCNQCPGEPVSVPDDPLLKKIFLMPNPTLP